MKKLILLVCFILMFSCKQNKVYEHTINKIHENKNSILLGKWMIYSWGYVQKINDSVPQALLEHCNACPYITFQKNDNGFIRTPDQKRIPFRWRMEGNKLIFKNSEADDNIVPNGTYKILRGKNKTVELLDSIRKFAYNLD